ncbi:hypothetical protein H4219_004134 [Mycoemilia scoparia]|uniref:ABC transporter domain-containing protein n=1 Tax=Mycoemilia scoparia TaxID=417184 RepID=A0A9W8A0R0_9FUNG|nr:hypothetical protein H4219_004134 [Mycoemilia scoparia]
MAFGVLVPWVSMLIDKKNKGDDGSGGGSLVVNSSSGSLFYNIDRVRETIRTLLKCQLVQWLRTRSIETNNPEMDDCFGIFGDAHFVWSLDTPPISDIPLDQTTGNLDFVKLDQMSPVFCQKLIQLNIPAPPQLTTTKGSNSNNGDINKEYADTINKPDGGFYLHNINIKIPKGKLTLITGPTGCGKTSLLLALMGEMCCIKGNIKFPFELNTNFCPTISSSNTSGAKGAWELSGVGYVAQQPWIENTTIRENILFGSAMNKRRYLQVLEACALIVDIDDMEHRDLTLVGDNGVRLSGGQKQRINLARALYSDSRVLVIDDCLSAVDILTANHILFRCISRNGSEISVGRTVVLATNHVAMCAPVADSVVVVENGTVKAQGSTKELADQGVIMLDKEGSGELGLSNNKESEKLESDVVKDVDWLIDEEDTAGNSKHTTIHSSNADKYIDNELEQNDDRASTNFIKQNFSILYKIVVLCGGIWFLVKPALLTFIESFTNKIGDYWVGLLSSSISNSAKPTAVSSSTTTLLAMGPLGFVLGKTLIEVINTLSGSLRYSFTFDSDIYETHNQTILKKIMQNLANATPGFFQETPLNLISSEAFGTAYDIFEEFQEIFDSFLESLFEGLGIVVILVVSAPGSIVHLVIILAIYYVYSLHSIRMDNVIEDIQMSIRKTSIGTSKVIYSLKTDDSARATIRGFGMTQKHIDKEIEAVEANYSFGRFNSDYREQNAVCLKIISAFSNFFITYLLVSGLISVAHSGKMSASGKEDFDSTSGGGGQGSSGFVIKQSVLLSSFIWYMITDFMQFYTLRTSLRTLSKYVELPQELPAIIPENRPPLLWPASGNIKVKNLSSSYDKRTASVIKDSSGGGGGGADDHDSSEEPNGERSRPNSPLIQENKSKTTTPTTKTAVAKETRMVLKDVSFEIKGGEKVGIVGRTGAGKSTLVLTLLRFLEPKSSTTGNADGGGTIEIDGIDVTKIGLDDLRRNMTMIPQEPSLLQGTLRHNLDPFDEFEDDDLWDALLKIGIFKTKPTDNDDNADSNKAGESVNSSSDDCDSGSSGEDSIAKKKGAGKSKWRFLLKLKPRVINDLQAKLNGIAAKAFKYRKDVNRLYKSIKSLLLVWSKIMAIKALNRAHSVAVSCLPKNLYASGFLELIKMVSPHSGLAINEKQPSPSTNVSNINNPEYVSGTDTTDDSNDEEEDENQMFIDELEDQNTLKSLNTRINAGGKNLSLGQRQMITLARAMVRKSKILIMDEATASLDFETDKHIQKFLRSEAFSQTTMLCIAHRLQTIIDYDKVMVIDRGRVAEFDQPYKLLQNTESKFYEMCFKSGQFGMLYSMAEKKFKKSTVSNVLVN